ncbi:MAG: hydrogenase, partial [Verrucomicrobia bacterium]|nr:hydrogenase [Verrucomicrobiota bacterium]NDB75376.1 hydrogenase [Verrucomicrobiota bacterium]NDE98623.1 hydrogenase [Verrucomicrobiota bacterium]
MSAAAEHSVPSSVKIAPPPVELERQPLVLHNRSIGWISDHIAGICEGDAPKWWLPALIFSVSLLTMMGACIAYLIVSGVGVWGLNQPVAWAWDITNFVFWIGIGHAGTLISAILFLLRQKWRTSVNRAAEAMTLFAVACAGIFPLIHVGRIWYALWWLPPIPNNYDIWPQFRSPLLWDVFAVSTYGTVSLLFWYTGLIPDLATMRDRATSKVKKFLYGFFAFGWTGS